MRRFGVAAVWQNQALEFALRAEPLTMASKLKRKQLSQTLPTTDLEQQLPRLQRAAQLNPRDPVTLTQLGEAYRTAQRLEEAATTLVSAVSLKPDHAAASFQLGLTLRALKEPEPALACFTRATDVEPDRFAHQLELAHELRQAEQYERAVGHYQCAIALDPGKLEALIGLSYSLRQLDRYDGAIAISKRAIGVAPSSPAGPYELGKALSGQGRYDAAIAAFRQALQLSRDHADSHFGIACAMTEVGQLSQALQHFRRSLELRPADRHAHSNLLYMMLFAPETTAEDLLREARAWSRSYAEPLTPEQVRHVNTREPERRLRIGYVAPTFRNHCQAFFLQPLLSHHDHEQLEVFCYSSTPITDEVTESLRRYADVWRDVRHLDDGTLAEVVRHDQIDILVDLNMHMAESRLCVFAHRPAPIQMTWLAYPGTTGLAAIDYRITDRLLDPPGTEHLYAERSLYLPDAFWCYDPRCENLDVSALPAQHNGYVTFGCLNAFWKQNTRAFDLWAQVMHAVQGSRIVIMAPPGGAQAFVQQSFQAAGISPERVECVPRQQRLDYLKTYHRIDLCLDSIPYNGHTTSLDAFWMGVPVITLVGDRVVGRAGLCQATLLDLPQLVAHDVPEFVERARAAASDLEGLAELRAGLRQRLESSPLMDATRFARNLEALYRGAWRNWCAAVTTP